MPRAPDGRALRASRFAHPTSQLAAVLWLASALCLGSCSAYTVQRDWDPDVSFSPYRSFALPPLSHAEGAQGDKSQLTVLVRATVTAAMKQRGYRYDAHEPQLLVSHRLGAKTKTRGTKNSGYGPYYWSPSYRDRGNYQVTQGSLTLTVVDRIANRVVWQAHGETRVSGDESPEELQRKLREIVAKMLSHFPPDD